MDRFVMGPQCLLRASPCWTQKIGKSCTKDLGKKLAFHCWRVARAHKEGSVWRSSLPVSCSIVFSSVITLVRTPILQVLQPCHLEDLLPSRAPAAHPSAPQRMQRRSLLPACWEKEPSQGSFYSPLPCCKLSPCSLQQSGAGSCSHPAHH